MDKFDKQGDVGKRADRHEEFDKFWDISRIVPSSPPLRKTKRSTDTYEIEILPLDKSGTAQPASPTEKPEESTVIKRYIDPLYFDKKQKAREFYQSEVTYCPQSLLIHSVTLRKLNSHKGADQAIYSEALKYSKMEGKPAEFVEFYSIYPTYSRLSASRRDYYLWWRDSFKRGNVLQSDCGYVYLYIFELINLGDTVDVKESHRMLARLWNVYCDAYPMLDNILGQWICDFGLVHRLPPPDNIDRTIVKRMKVLREYYICIPQNDYKAASSAIMKYGSEYDYRKSRFATEKNLPMFDRYIHGAMESVIRALSEDGRILSKVEKQDIKLMRHAFSSAPCDRRWAYDLSVKYCSFSRSNEFRFIMGDVIKYSENKIRAMLSIKSRLSVYSLDTDIQRAIDDYFERVRQEGDTLARQLTRKKEEVHEYDSLYDLPTKVFSLENAKQIERESWSTTYDLISAFDGDENAEQSEVLNEPCDTPQTPLDGQSEASKAELTTMPDSELSPLACALGQHLSYVLALKNGDIAAQKEYLAAQGLMRETLIDRINEISADLLGDILLEESEDGVIIVEDYADML